MQIEIQYTLHIYLYIYTTEISYFPFLFKNMKKIFNYPEKTFPKFREFFKIMSKYVFMKFLHVLLIYLQ